MKSEDLNVLVLNCGSSSLKYKIIKMPEEKEILWGEAERIGIKTAGKPFITHVTGTKKRVIEADLSSLDDAFSKALELIKEDTCSDPSIYFDIFAHRYVHPGKFFSSTSRILEKDIGKLRKTLELAPIHNPSSFSLIEKCSTDYTDVPQYAVFDTTFHKTIPEENKTYALPVKMIKKYDLHRVGFHGISHKYVMEEACRFLGADVKTQKIISCHLGTGGASVCAIRDGKSIYSSMGFTPLEGLIMNTRSGDLDMGYVLNLMYSRKLSIDETEKILNKKSGILGVYSQSSDLRDVMKNLGKDVKADIAFSMYIKRIRKYLGFYSLLLKKPDILIFTDSIGISSPLVREQACANLEFLGIRLDKDKNRNYRSGIIDAAGPGSECRILILPTNEEIMIAREAYRRHKNDICH